MNNIGAGVKFSAEAMLGKLNTTMDAVVEGIDGLHEWLTANPVQTPFSFTLVNSIVTAASAATYNTIPLIGTGGVTTGPSGGNRWAVGRVSITGGSVAAGAAMDGFTVLAGSQAGLFKSGTTPASGPIAPTIGLVALSGANGGPTTIPWSQAFPAHSVMVNPTEDIYLIVKGAGNNMLLTAEIEVLVYNERQRLAP
jgi:hypothetical protein